MTSRIILLIVLLACSWISNLAGASNRVILEPRTSIPQAWNEIEEIEGQLPLQLIFAVKQQNVNLLEQRFLEVSDPRHPRYGQHLTKKEIEELIAPHPESKQTILNWLRNHLRTESNYKIEELNDFIIAVVPARIAEKMLDSNFVRFTHKETGKRLVRSNNGYSLPEEVAKHVDFVGGVSHFPKLTRAKIEKTPIKSDMKREEPGLGVTPRILRDRYGVGDTLGKSPKNKQAVAQFLDQFYDEFDLQEFFTLFFWPAIGNSVDQVIGNNTALEPGVEASLDIQYIMAMGGDIPTWFYSTLGLHENQEPFLEWALIVASESDEEVPKVISVSYGDDEDSVDFPYASRINVEFQKLGARGISILFASGDSGVGCNGNGTAFVPNFPASSPWVTAVGGTTTEGWFETGDEMVNSLSGGGFSNYFGMPSYQQQAVANYFANAKDLPDPSLYNRTGRAYPDVSAMSAAFTIVFYGIPMPGVAGTSCAAPTFSGIIALLNDLRYQNGKSPLGFLNLWIYQTAVEHPEAFFDVTDGCNPGFGCPSDGFCATKGWDPSSGVGTPRYDKMAELMLQLP